MDPSFTRLIKLEILTALALEPASSEAVLNELRTYVRHGDKKFACASIRAVGTVVELSRIVHDRQGAKTGDKAKQRGNANRIALNCLHGLAVLTKASESSFVTGECVVVMQRILLQLSSGDSGDTEVKDPNHVQDMALQRILLLLVNTLSMRSQDEEDEDSDDDNETEPHRNIDLKKVARVELPSPAVAAALWVIGEWASPRKGKKIATACLKIQAVDESTFFAVRMEICRLLAKSFTFLDSREKEQALNFATKVIVSSKCQGQSVPSELALCESILSMGRLEVVPDVRDRARCESNLVHLAATLQFDQENMEPNPMVGMIHTPTLDSLNRIFLCSKPASSSLPLEDVHYKQRAEMGESGGDFRFGTLSSLVGHRARCAYIPLPHWASEDTSSSVRDPQKKEAASAITSNGNADKANSGSFYEGSDSSDDSSSSDSDSENESSVDSNSDDDSSESSITSKESADLNEDLLPTMPNQPFASQMLLPNQRTNPQTQSTLDGLVQPAITQRAKSVVDAMSSDDNSDSSSESDSDSESSTEEEGPNTMGGIGSLIPMGGTSLQHANSLASTKTSVSASSSAVDDLKGLVLDPVVVDADAQGQPNREKDSSDWFDFVRSGTGGGISAKARYLRGQTKAKELQLIGMSDSASTVCLEIRFENQ